MSVIKALVPREILDGRGNPTIELTLYLDNNTSIITSAANNKTQHKAGVFELLDEDFSRMNGRGVLKAIDNIKNVIAPKIIGMNPANQAEIDQLMIDIDGTSDKKKLGSNTILVVSQAIIKAAALAHNLPIYSYIQQKYRLNDHLFIPQVIYGVINGSNYGTHNLDLQEFQIITASYLNFQKSLEIISTIWQKLEENLISKGAITTTGIVGGFAPNLYSNTDAFEILLETIRATDYTLSKEIFLGIDCAAHHFYNNNKYKLKNIDKAFSANSLLNYYQEVKNDYQIIYIEDPFINEDVQTWANLTNVLGKTTCIAGDSLLLVGMKQLEVAINKKLCNTVVIKPAHFGTITETINFIHKAKQAGMKIVVSHRSGETNDDFIADFSVGVGADYAKFGPVNRGERVVKYNRLLKIFYELNPNHQIGSDQQKKVSKQTDTAKMQNVAKTSSTIKLQTPESIEVKPTIKNNIQVKDSNMTDVTQTPVAAKATEPEAKAQQPAQQTQQAPVQPQVAQPGVEPAVSSNDPITAPSTTANTEPVVASENNPANSNVVADVTPLEAPAQPIVEPTVGSNDPITAPSTTNTPNASQVQGDAVNKNEMQDELNQEVNSSLKDLQK